MASGSMVASLSGSKLPSSLRSPDLSLLADRGTAQGSGSGVPYSIPGGVAADETCQVGKAELRYTKQAGNGQLPFSSDKSSDSSPPFIRWRLVKRESFSAGTSRPCLMKRVSLFSWSSRLFWIRSIPIISGVLMFFSRRHILICFLYCFLLIPVNVSA